MQTETKQSRIIFPCHLNDNDTLFGGIALEWMDEVAYITAVRYSRKKMMTISVNNLQFHHPLKPGMVAEISGKIIGTGKVRLEVMVEIFAEDMYSCTTQKAVNALFTLVAVDEKMKAVRLE